MDSSSDSDLDMLSEYEAISGLLDDKKVTIGDFVLSSQQRASFFQYNIQ